MSEKIKHADDKAAYRKGGFTGLMARVFGRSLLLYGYDFLCMRFSRNLRYRQLGLRVLKCRFCDEDIHLLGIWKCECGFTRPGNYFGRCPKCLGTGRFIDCPACGVTMDVR
jgi:hypothetical protein